ncbi:MAG: 1-phosphofructokinase family hexose kinase [Bdellovibrionia bacterium]
MIYTITPNPALDTCGVVDRLVPDEKNYVSAVTNFPGGNGVNVARVLTRLKVECVASGFLGGSIGEELFGALRREKVQCDFVEIEGHTRMSVTVTQSKTGCQTRLSFPGPVIRKSEALALSKKVRNMEASSILMCGGSLPGNYSVQDLVKLLKLAKSQGLRLVVDCPGKLLRPLIEAQPSLIKPNIVEFQQLMGKKLHSVETLARSAKTLLKQVQLVCVSSVDGGALLVTQKGTWYGKGKSIKACSTVGAGDSMVAGMISRMTLNDDWDELAPELLRRGIAAGMATASQPTGYLGQATDIQKFSGQVRIKRISS